MARLALHLKFYGDNLYFHALLSSISNFNTYSIKMQVLCLWFSSRCKTSSNTSLFPLDLRSSRSCLFLLCKLFCRDFGFFGDKIYFILKSLSLSSVLLFLSHAGTRFSAVVLTERVTCKSCKTTWSPQDPASVAWTVALEKPHVASQIPNPEP